MMRMRMRCSGTNSARSAAACSVNAAILHPKPARTPRARVTVPECTPQYGNTEPLVGQSRDDAPEPSPSPLQALGLVLSGVAASVALTTAGPAVAMNHNSLHSAHQQTVAQMSMDTAVPAAPVCTPAPEVDRPSAYDNAGYTHRSSARNATAQKLIDQGLLLAYNYNQYEAKNAFEAALRVEPDAVMAYWGLAYANGPFLNKVAAPAPTDMSYPTFTQQELEEGRKAIDKGLTYVEQQLLEAKVQRLELKDETARIAALERDRAYLLALAPVFQHDLPYGPGWEKATISFARSLEEWAQTHPDDADALAFAAEAYSNLQPWDFWDVQDPRKPRGNTLHILGLLDKALALAPDHPLAAHLRIHTTEASTPEMASTATQYAEGMGARYTTFGHLVHMPSHTYLRTGRWHDAVEANVKALNLDVTHAASCLAPDMPSHNGALAVYAAMTAAEPSSAQQVAQAISRYPELFGPSYMSEGKDKLYLPFAQLRFALWSAFDRITPQSFDQSQDGIMLPGGSVEFQRAMYHYFSSLKLAAKASAVSGPSAETYKARAAQQAEQLAAAVAQLPPDSVTKPGTGVGVYSPGFKGLGEHAVQTSAARLATLDKDWDSAARHLQTAVRIESELGYMEPPRFHQPQRECLGWVYLQAGKLPEAAAAYLQVLDNFPRSPWALTGLRDVLQAAALQPAVQLPAGTPSLQETENLLRQLKAESKGKAVELPSSCPAFSVADKGSSIRSSPFFVAALD